MIEADLVIVDVDDTLILTENDAFRIENIIVSHLGHLPMTREAHLLNWGQPLHIAIAERVPGINVSDFMDLVAVMIPEYAAKGEIDMVSHQNIETLERLVELGKKLAILTSRTLAEAKHLIDPEHHLNKHVEKFYYKGHGPYAKPDPRVFETPLAEFGIPAQRSLYVGDSIGDGIAANGAGLAFIASLEGGHRKVADFKDIKVDAFINRFPEILEVVI